MKWNSIKLTIGTAILWFGAGCALGNYRVVKVVKGGGELALVGSQGEAREKANAYMTQQCNGGYEVVEEGEAVIGENTEAHRAFLGGVQASSTQKTEWRIKFACKGEAAPATTPTTPGTPAAPAAPASPSAKIHIVSIRI